VTLLTIVQRNLYILSVHAKKTNTNALSKCSLDAEIEPFENL
jgi:hypothetical protein